MLEICGDGINESLHFSHRALTMNGAFELGNINGAVPYIQLGRIVLRASQVSSSKSFIVKAGET